MPPTSPRSFGDYLLLGEIARGGMGIVYQAVHVPLQRACALKVIRAGTFATAAEEARFAVEAEASAALEHPHIVRVRHAGKAEGQFFLEMALVEGGTLADQLRLGPLPPRGAARLVAQLARAVAHAHDRGVLHRDLKPANVLLDAQGFPQLTDFGLARLLDRESDLTRTLAVLGTPAYLAPELASGGAAATTLADVYGLGAILFECLAGSPPYGGESALAVLNAVQQGPPASLARVRPGIPRDLAILVSRAMAREPASRLPSARDLADELERWSRGEPIRSRPIPLWERTWAWARRHPGPTVLSVALVLALATGFSVIEGQRRRARALSRDLLQQLTLAEMRQAAADFSNERGRRGLATLARCLRRDPGNSLAAQLLALRLGDRGWPRPRAILPTAGASLVTAIATPDGSRIVGATDQGDLRAWRVPDGSPIQRIYSRASGSWQRLDCDDTGQWLLGLGADGTLRLWPEAGGDPNLDWHPSDGPVRDARFQPGRARLAVARDRSPVSWWDPALPDPIRWLPEESREARALAFHPSGNVLAIGDGAGRIRRWHVDDSRWDTEIRVDGAITGLGFGDEGRVLVATLDRRMAVVLRLPEGTELMRTPHRHAEPIRFNPGGNWFLAETSADVLMLARQPQWRPRPFPGTCRLPEWGPVFSRDGTRILLDADARGLQPFLLAANSGPREIGEPIRPGHALRHALFLADPNHVVVGSLGEDAVLWEINREHPTDAGRSLDDELLAVGFTSDGLETRALRSDGMLRVLRYPSLRPDAPRPLAGPDISAAAFAPGARTVAVARGESVELHPIGAATTNVLVLPAGVAPVRELVFGPDGASLVLLDASLVLRIWDVPGRRWRADPIPAPHGLPSLASSRLSPGPQLEFSRSGHLLGVTYPSGTAVVVEVATGLVRSRLDLGEPLLRVLPLPETSRAVVAGTSGTLRILDLDTGAAPTSSIHHGSILRDVALAEDGRVLATAGDDGFVRIWDFASGQRLAELGGGLSMQRVRFLPGPSRTVVVTRERLVTLTALPWNQTLIRRRVAPLLTDRIAFAPGGRSMVVFSQRGRGEWVWSALPDEAPPAWVPDLAECLAGERLLDDGTAEHVPPTSYLRLREQLVRLDRPGYWHDHLLPGLLGIPGRGAMPPRPPSSGSGSGPQNRIP